MDNPNYYAILPASVRYDETLTDFAKILFAEITALSNKYGFCTASNGYFAELYKRNVSTISETISELQKRGYLRSEVEENYKRKIYPLVDPLLKKPKGVSGIPEGGVSGKAEDNTTSSNTKINSTAKAVFTIEPEAPKKNTKSESLPYEKALGWAENRTGRKFINRVKQYTALKKARAVGITGPQLTERWEELESKPFHEENGLDWCMVVSSFDRK